MSRQNVRREAQRTREAAPWRGTAFLVEACLLLAVIAGCVAVFAALFARSAAEGTRAEELTRAVVAARDAAEVFAAEGSGAAGEREVADGLHLSVDVAADEEVPGLLRAVIVVRDDEGTEVYRLETARAGGEAQ